MSLGPQDPPAAEAPRGRAAAQTAGLDPYLAYLIFTAIALGTWRLELHWRMTLLWLVLVGIVLIQSAHRPVRLGYEPRAIGRGLLAGLIVGLPFLVLTRPYLYAVANQLFAADRGLTSGSQILILLQRTVLIAPLVEEPYFRGILQEQKGLLPGSLAYGLTWLLYFAPGSQTPLFALAILFVVASLLGGYFGLVYHRYSLATAIVAHAASMLLLLILPPAIQELLKALA